MKHLRSLLALIAVFAVALTVVTVVPRSGSTAGRRVVDQILTQRDLWGSAIPVDTTNSGFTLGGGGSVDTFKVFASSDVDYQASQIGPFSTTTYTVAVVQIASIGGTIVAPDTVGACLDWSPDNLAWNSGTFTNAFITGSDRATSVPIKIDTQAQGTAYLSAFWRIRLRGNPVATPSLPKCVAKLRLLHYNQ